MKKYLFRFDDISINTPIEKFCQMITRIRDTVSTDLPLRVEFLLAVSPTVFDMSKESGLARERVYPAILNVESDYRRFYAATRLGIPRELIRQAGPRVFLAAHGMAHVDHRLLSRKAQELSIRMSCDLVGTDQFVPPFNKFNEKTERVCRDATIELVKPDGFRHLAYHKFSPDHHSYYLHTHDFEIESFADQLPQPSRG
jgi:hypothetical protein